jgi:hypothetical protein
VLKILQKKKSLIFSIWHQIIIIEDHIVFIKIFCCSKLKNSSLSSLSNPNQIKLSNFQTIFDGLIVWMVWNWFDLIPSLSRSGNLPEWRLSLKTRTRKKEIRFKYAFKILADTSSAPFAEEFSSKHTTIYISALSVSSVSHSENNRPKITQLKQLLP